MLIENAVGLMSVPLKPFIINELIKSNLRTLIMLAGMAAAVPSRSGQYFCWPFIHFTVFLHYTQCMHASLLNPIEF